MRTLGVELVRVDPGEVELALPFRQDLTQQHGFLHAGVLATAMDSACGYAAFSLMPPEAAVLSVEFKVDLLAPAAGESFRILGSVLKAGKTLSVSRGEAWARGAEGEQRVAAITATMMTLVDRQGLRG